MAIPPSLPPQLQLNSLLNKPLQLSVGQTVSGNIIKQAANSVLLQIGNQTISASLSEATSKQLPSDKPVQLLVAQVKPNVLLKVVPDSQQNTDLKTQLIQVTLRQVLPNQVSIGTGISQLFQIMQTGNLPIAIQAQLTVLLENLFRPKTQLKGSEIKAAFLNSGMFLESNLSKQNRSVTNDFKGSLLRLLSNSQAQASQQSAPPLSKLIETLTQMLNKITHRQLNALESPNHTQIEIPVYPEKYLLELSVDIRKQVNDSEQKWEMIITLNMPQGQLLTKVTYFQDFFSFLFWTDNAELEEQVEYHLDSFKEQLQRSGLSYDHLLISKTKPETSPESKQFALIDIHI